MGDSSVHHIALLLSMANSMGRRLFEGVLEFANENPELRWRFHIPLNPGSDLPENRHFSGVIVQASEPAALSRMDERGIPRVNVSSFLMDSRGPKVEVDNDAVGREAATHFFRRHYRNFGFLGMKGAHYSQAREQGFAREIYSRDGKGSLFSLSVDFGAGYLDAALPQEVAQWIESLPRPAGLFAASDGLARRVIEVCERNKIRCPDEIAVVGVDNDDIECAISPVKLSSVALPFRSIGYQAAEILAAQIGFQPAKTALAQGERNRMLPPLGIITRRSTESLAVEAPVVARALRFIRENAHRDISVTEVAEHCSVSRRYLERHFRAIFNSSPRGEIIRHRIHKVQVMLSETSLTVAEIAHRLEYQEPKYLHRAFRREVGHSPLEYRRMFGR